MGQVLNDHDIRSKYEDTILGFIGFPKRPWVHIFLCLLSGVLTVDIQLFNHVNFDLIRKHISQPININVLPMTAFMIVAVLIRSKMGFRESMNVLRHMVPDASQEKMEYSARRYASSLRGVLSNIFDTTIIIGLSIAMLWSSLFIMEKIF